MFETVDFPVAIEPVRPIRSIFGRVFFRVRLRKRLGGFVAVLIVVRKGGSVSEGEWYENHPMSLWGV